MWVKNRAHAPSLALPPLGEQKAKPHAPLGLGRVGRRGLAGQVCHPRAGVTGVVYQVTNDWVFIVNPVWQGLLEVVSSESYFSPACLPQGVIEQG